MITFIRRPGNKLKHLKHILPFIPEFEGTYIEPFVGTGALFLKITPNKWIINDINKDLMGIWKLVRDDPEFLLDEINKIKEKAKVDIKEIKVADEKVSFKLPKNLI